MIVRLLRWWWVRLPARWRGRMIEAGMKIVMPPTKPVTHGPQIVAQDADSQTWATRVNPN